MEKFEDLIDEYWDDAEVNRKILGDEETVETIGDSRKDSPFSTIDEISIDTFVNKFLDIKGDYTRFRHFELRNLDCPYVIGVANEYADNNPDFVINKKYLLIVIDRDGKRGTYINPIIAREFLNFDFEACKQTMNGRCDLEHLKEFFENYNKAKSSFMAYQSFFEMLVENKKDRKFKRIENYEKKLGDEENDKYKRK